MGTKNKLAHWAIAALISLLVGSAWMLDGTPDEIEAAQDVADEVAAIYGDQK